MMTINDNAEIIIHVPLVNNEIQMMEMKKNVNVMFVKKSVKK
jgi:hypothetical protein